MLLDALAEPDTTGVALPLREGRDDDDEHALTVIDLLNALDSVAMVESDGDAEAEGDAVQE